MVLGIGAVNPIFRTDGSGYRSKFQKGAGEKMRCFKMLADATLIEQLLMRARADASPSSPAYFATTRDGPPGGEMPAAKY